MTEMNLETVRNPTEFIRGRMSANNLENKKQVSYYKILISYQIYGKNT
ncbi:MAG: hypothetical protein M1538_01560 [Candidatus Marsarchaeota archaeon]|nr:hypothetical protein [Candidatus Marsarchaeota archaeon]